MFEAVELGHKADKKEYKSEVPELRFELLKQQYELLDQRFSVILVIAGDDRIGRNDMINVLHEWMDPRHLEANAFEALSDEELQRPFFWRFWRALPADGRVGIFVRDWTMQAITNRIYDGKKGEAKLEQRMEHIRRFEKGLIDDGNLVVKIWLHLPRKELRKKLKRAEENPDQEWKVQEHDWVIYKDYEKGRKVVEKVLRQTTTAEAPWHIVESTDERYRNLMVGRIVRDALGHRLQHPETKERRIIQAFPDYSDGDPKTILDKIDLSQELAKKDYAKLRPEWQGKLSQLFRQARKEKVATILVFEGWDAAGKGGAIRRITYSMDAANYRVIRIAAPTEEERAHHYLWRFWRHLPQAGKVSIFDRSWYGRVLVERIEKFATTADWMRAYNEINDFEEQLCQHGIVLVKFWIHIDQAEQMHRFEKRKNIPFKKYKSTEEDYRNRSKWSEYEKAANDMIERTSTEYAPWNLIAGNDKRWARVEILKTLEKSLQAALALE